MINFLDNSLRPSKNQTSDKNLPRNEPENFALPRFSLAVKLVKEFLKSEDLTGNNSLTGFINSPQS